MMLGIEEIEKIIPHRHPFLLIDRLEELFSAICEALPTELSATVKE